MVAKISVGSSLYGAIAYNWEKINEAQGRLLASVWQRLSGWMPS